MGGLVPQQCSCSEVSCSGVIGAAGLIISSVQQNHPFIMLVTDNILRLYFDLELTLIHAFFTASNMIYHTKICGQLSP